MNRYIKTFGIIGFISVLFCSYTKSELMTVNVKNESTYNGDGFSSVENTNSRAITNEIELIIQANGINIGGTLTIPTQQKTNSLVIMSSGSGDQGRDGTLDGFEIFKIIAKHLASQGIATFRYDDRGTGSSTGDFYNSTLEELSEDVENILSFFKSHKDHSFKDFILFGHSQGGIVAGKVAVENKDVKQIILMGVPAVPLVEVVLYQVRQEYASTILDKSLIEADVSAHNRLMRVIKDGKNRDNALKVFNETTQSILSKLRTSKNDETLKIEKIATDKTNQFENIYASPSLASFLYYDPSGDYEKVHVPVLVLFGGKDIQVTIDQNKDRMENALLKSKADAHLVTFNDANHYFQKAKTGKREEYGTLKNTFVNGFLDEISTWILDN